MSGLDGYTRRTKTFESGGMKLEFSELQMYDYAKFEDYLKQKKSDERDVAVTKMLDALKDSGNQTAIDKVLECLQKPITLADGESEAAMATPAGMSFLMWRSLSYKMPSLTLEEVAKVVTPDLITKVMNFVAGTGEAKKKRPRQPIKKGS